MKGQFIAKEEFRFWVLDQHLLQWGIHVPSSLSTIGPFRRILGSRFQCILVPNPLHQSRADHRRLLKLPLLLQADDFQIPLLKMTILMMKMTLKFTNCSLFHNKTVQKIIIMISAYAAVLSASIASIDLVEIWNE